MGVVGVLIGVSLGFGLSRPIEPRFLLNWKHCEEGACLRMNEVLGLAASIGVRFAPGLLPQVIRETDYSIALRHPMPEARVHYIVIPKKDIKNIGVLSANDQAYLVDAFALMQEVIQADGLQTYLIKTNGPGYQDVAYLHFHVIAE